MLHRDRELAVIGEAFAALEAGHPSVVVIEGGRGSGKSTLLREAVANIPTMVLRARCHSAERDFEFGVVGQLFDRLPLDKLDSVATAPAFLSSVRESPEHDVLDGFYRVTRAVAANGPVVLAIDDAHLADRLSARWCSYVARRLDDLPVGLLLTVNSGDHRGDGAHAWVDELKIDLANLAHSRLVRIGPLCLRCTEDLLCTHVGGPVDPDFLRRCYSLTRGNPQVLSTVAARLALAKTNGSGPVNGAALVMAARMLAHTAMDWLRQDEPVRADLVEQFAVCADGTLDFAAMLIGQGEDVASSARIALRQMGLLARQAPDRFAHPAIGEAILRRLSPRTRADLHVRAAAVLSRIGEPASLTAEHVMSVGVIGEQWVQPMLRQAAREAAVTGDWPRAARYLSRALLEPGAPSQVLCLAAELGAVQIHHDVGGSLRRLTFAADLAAGDTNLVGALAGFADPVLTMEDVETASVFGPATTKLATDPDSDRSALLRLAAQTLLSGGEQSRGLAEAIRRLHSGPDDLAARQLQSVLALGVAGRGRNRKRTRMLALRAAGGSPVRLRESLPSTIASAALALVWAGETQAAADACSHAFEAAHRISSRTSEALARYVRSEIAYHRGDLEAAAADARDAMELCATSGATSLRITAAAHLIRIRLLRGDTEDFPNITEDPGAGTCAHPYALAIQQEARGMLAAAQGNHGHALRLYLESGRHLMGAGLHNPACSAWRSRAAAALVTLGRGWEARTLADAELALARTWGAPGPLGRALVAAAGAHDGQHRLDLLTEAVQRLEDTDCRLDLARALIRQGAAMHEHGWNRSSREVLERGLDLANACGAAALSTIARRSLQAAGARPRERQGQAELTAAERRVAELVMRGLSNQAVAAMLTLSRRTVDTHLGRIYRKLGITGRSRLGEALAKSEG
jgi:DNA-binding CsgD family transcriptional regulator